MQSNDRCISPVLSVKRDGIVKTLPSEPDVKMTNSSITEVDLSTIE